MAQKIQQLNSSRSFPAKQSLKCMGDVPWTGLPLRVWSNFRVLITGHPWPVSSCFIIEKFPLEPWSTFGTKTVVIAGYGQGLVNVPMFHITQLKRGYNFQQIRLKVMWNKSPKKGHLPTPDGYLPFLGKNMNGSTCHSKVWDIFWILPAILQIFSLLCLEFGWLNLHIYIHLLVYHFSSPVVASILPYGWSTSIPSNRNPDLRFLVKWLWVTSPL